MGMESVDICGHDRENEETSSRNRERPLGHDIDNRHVLPGRVDWLCLGRLGTLHGLAVESFRNELGVQAPAGFWDPLGFTADGNVASFRRRRSVELKHSRICMLAAIGYMQPELTGKWPGFLSPSAGLKFADIPNGLGAISKVPALGWAQIVALFGFTEFSGGFEDYKSGTPGDYGWKVLTSADPAEKTKKLAAELANGRLAMVAIIGMFFQDGLTGSAWGDWALYTDSPLRANQ